MLSVAAGGGLPGSHSRKSCAKNPSAVTDIANLLPTHPGFLKNVTVLSDSCDAFNENL